jgi:hypothetical protein
LYSAFKRKRAALSAPKPRSTRETTRHPQTSSRSYFANGSTPTTSREALEITNAGCFPERWVLAGLRAYEPSG